MWIVERADGLTVTMPNEPDAELDGPIIRMAEIDRAGAADGTEDFDWDAGAWVVNVERGEDWENKRHLAMMGSAAIDQAHAVKSIEARLMLAGVMLDGLVAAEAAATDQEPLDLAEIIVAQSDVDNAAEVARIVARRTIRQNAGSQPG